MKVEIGDIFLIEKVAGGTCAIEIEVLGVERKGYYLTRRMIVDLEGKEQTVYDDENRIVSEKKLISYMLA